MSACMSSRCRAGPDSFTAGSFATGSKAAAGKPRSQHELSQSSSSVVSVRGTGSQLKKMTMTAALTLTDRATGEVVLSDTVSATATLGAVSAYFAQTRSDRHGAERLAVLLADRAAARVHLFFLNDDEK